MACVRIYYLILCMYWRHCLARHSSGDVRAGSWALSSSWQVTHTRTITAEQWDWCLVSWQSHYNWDKELTIVFLSLSVSAGDCAHCQRDNHWFSITCEELTPGRWSGGWWCWCRHNLIYYATLDTDMALSPLSDWMQILRHLRLQ